MPHSKRELIAALNYDIAAMLCTIEDLCKSYGLTTCSRLTVIVRDPDDLDMTLVTTNDDLEEACRVALTHTREIPLA